MGATRDDEKTVVTEELGRVLASTAFAQSESLKRLLRFVVEETLQGRADQIKEYVIGSAVLGKGESFDPKADPVVRVQARRLRAKLEEFYDTEGLADPIRIEVPKGGYSAIFPRQSIRSRKKLFSGVPTVALIAAGVCLAILAFVSIALRWNSKPVHSIGILPFESLSAEEPDGYFAQGLTQELTHALMQLQPVRVVPLRSREQQRTAGPAITTLLTGSVRKSGTRIRITASLTDAGAGHQIWSEVYERELKDLFDIQEQIARSIVQALRITLAKDTGTRLVARKTDNPEAYDWYLKGRYFLGRKGRSSENALRCFEQALAIDPNFALAYAGKADAYTALAFNGLEPPRNFRSKMKDAAMKALELNSEVAETHTALAGIKISWEWDFPGAETACQRALALNPKYPTAHAFYAIYLSAMGRHQQAIEHGRRAAELDPVAPNMSLMLTNPLYHARRYEEALEQARKTIDLDPTYDLPHRLVGLIYLRLKQCEPGLVQLRRAVELSPEIPFFKGTLAYGLGLCGRKEEARTLLDQLLEQGRRTYLPPVIVSHAYLGLGERQNALEWLGKALDEGPSWWLLSLKVDPMYDPLRTDPKFIAFLSKFESPSPEPQ